MGVPKFFRYISERYPCLSELVKETQVIAWSQRETRATQRNTNIKMAFIFSKTDSGVWQSVSWHEWNYTQLLASGWLQRPISHHRRANFSRYFPLYWHIISHDATAKIVLYGCRWGCTASQNEPSTWPKVKVAHRVVFFFIVFVLIYKQISFGQRSRTIGGAGN